MTDNVALTNDDVQKLIEQLAFVMRYGRTVERDAAGVRVSRSVRHPVWRQRLQPPALPPNGRAMAAWLRLDVGLLGCPGPRSSAWNAWPTLADAKGRPRHRPQ